ncbi:MAG: biotin--[acetyl-CoA-carboxylase] ligase [Acidobacteria bacterium]|nr:biotin--[acetyl-CoA-carboxylase] ligase [Acidobacteriota bacterium]
MAADSDLPARLAPALDGTIFNGSIFHYPSIDSTNRVALERAKLGGNGDIFIADEQTAGRGRGGHTWHSAADDGLYLSVLIRPKLNASDVLKISLATGLAAQAAIHQVTGLHIDIRWPNDLILPSMAGRKCGGILTETALLPDGALAYAVIGIGINLNQTELPVALQHLSASLRMAAGTLVSRDEVAAALLTHLSSEISRLESAPESVLARFEEASTWAHGKRVSVAEDEGYTGTTDGLSATGLLRVRCDDGSVREVRHGGVREA